MRIFKRILMFCLMGMTLTAGLTGCSGKVEFVDEIPSEARKAVDNGGTVEHFFYPTKDYAGDMSEFEKEACIYLPPDYDESKQYNVMFLLHGVGGDLWEWAMTDNNSEVKKIADNMILNEGVETFIIVTPNGRSTKDCHNTSFDNIQGFYLFGQELRNDLIPYIDEHYATYADYSEGYDITAARDHRACAGLSMGGMQTTNIALCECLDLFSYFGAFSSCPTTYSASDIATRLSDDKFEDYDIKYFYNICGLDDGVAIASHTNAMGIKDAKGEGEDLEPQLLELCDKLSNKNFTWHTRSGGHDFGIWHLGFYNFSHVAFTR